MIHKHSSLTKKNERKSGFVFTNTHKAEMNPKIDAEFHDSKNAALWAKGEAVMMKP